MKTKFTEDVPLEQIRDALECMPRVVQEADQPLETILNMYVSELPPCE